MLDMAVPVDEPGEDDPEGHGKRKEHPDRRVVPVVHGVQSQGQAKTCRNTEGDNNGAPVNGEVTGENGYFVHGVPSVSGMAVAK